MRPRGKGCVTPHCAHRGAFSTGSDITFLHLFHWSFRCSTQLRRRVLFRPQSFPCGSATSLLTMEPVSVSEVPGMSWAPVYQFVKQIPRGRVITYGGLAEALRLRGGARTAGRAMAGTPSGKGIPWHRVVGDRGKLLIREPYASLQRKLLASEGVELLESRVDLKVYLWQPAKSAKAAAIQKPKKKRTRG
jgi:methylated-DNA-protein-cysteine methyltransferase related protein